MTLWYSTELCMAMQYSIDHNIPITLTHQVIPNADPPNNKVSVLHISAIPEIMELWGVQNTDTKQYLAFCKVFDNNGRLLHDYAELIDPQSGQTYIESFN